jgi:hypothetical protein
MNELIEGVNWTAVLVGFVVSYLLGWFWYSPQLFGIKWAKGVGVSLEGDSVMPVFAMVTQAFGTFCLAWLVGITATNNALFTIILILTTIIFLIISNGKYAQKSNAAVAIEASYILVMGIVMIVCQKIF